MPYAFITSNGYIKAIHPKVSPFYRLTDGEWIAPYNPPQHDPKVEIVEPIQPVTTSEVQFTISPHPEAAQRVKEHKISVIQQALDKGARDRGYDNILSAVTYGLDSASPFYLEGLAYAKWRSDCWATGFQILSQVEANVIPVPEDQELVNMLPALEI